MNFLFCSSIVLIACLSVVSCHTFVIQPISRDNNVATNNNGGAFECGGNANNQGTYTRGQVIDFSWGRNNHYGGFVQVSVIAKSLAPDINNAGVRASLDQPTNIIHVSCYNQASCLANPTWGDFIGRGGDGPNSQFQSNVCRTKMTIPSYLADNDYVMKTVFFGNGDSLGVRNLPHPAYTSCHNFRVAGGAAVTVKAANNAHIEWGAPGVGLYDQALTIFGNKPQGSACLFHGTVTHQGCAPTNVPEQIACTGKVADVSRCGSQGADTVQTCLGSNTADQTRGGSVFNYMYGLPAFHPAYNGKYTMILENRQTKEVVVDADITSAPTATASTRTPTTNTPTTISPSTISPSSSSDTITNIPSSVSISTTTPTSTTNVNTNKPSSSSAGTNAPTSKGATKSIVGSANVNVNMGIVNMIVIVGISSIISLFVF